LPVPGDLDPVGEATESAERPTGATIHGYVLVTTRREERPSAASVIGRSPAKAGGQVVWIQVRVGERGLKRGAYCVTVKHLAKSQKALHETIEASVTVRVEFQIQSRLAPGPARARPLPTREQKQLPLADTLLPNVDNNLRHNAPCTRFLAPSARKSVRGTR
jgi:hypothetical protein